MKVFVRSIVLVACLYFLAGFFCNVQAVSTGITVNLTTCGDGVIQSGEQCDGSNLNSKSCTDLGFTEGNLSCNAGCTFNTSNCLNNPCFLAGTKILLANSLFKNIEEVKIGDVVWGYDVLHGKKVSAEVTQTFVHEASGYLIINDLLKVTANHPLWNNNQWLPAGQIKIGSKLLGSNGQDIKVNSVIVKNESAVVYNLEVAGVHNYYAENILVHNKCSGESDLPILTLTNVSSSVLTRADISWNATDASGIRTISFAYGTSDLYGSYATVDNLGTNQYRASLSSLSTNQTYYYRITAVDNANCQNSASLVGSFQTAGNPTDNPPVISNVASTTLQTAATVFWQVSDNDATGVSSVKFYYGLSSYGPEENLTLTANGIYNKSLTGLLSGQTYHFKITASDGVNPVVIHEGTFKTLTETPALVISNILSTPGITTCGISWQTNRETSGQILYGTSTNYGLSSSDDNLLVSHAISLTDLSPGVIYHYKIVATDSGNVSTSTVDRTFTTGSDPYPPSDVSDFNLSVVGAGFGLSWTNPSLTGANADFAGVKILRKIGSASTGRSDGTVVFTGLATNFTDDDVVKDTRYYYTIYSYDSSGNHSPGITRNGIIIRNPLSNVSGLSLSVINKTINLIWTNPQRIGDNINFSGVKILRKTGGPAANLEDGELIKTTNAESYTDISAALNTFYYYTVFSYDSLGRYSSGTSTNGQITYNCQDHCEDDPACATDPACVPTVDCSVNCSQTGCCAQAICTNSSVCKPVHLVEICNNGIDDDNNGLIDCKDSACFGFSGCTHTGDDTGSNGVPSTISLNKLLFSTGAGKIILWPFNEVVTGLAGFDLTVAINKSSLAEEPQKISLIVGNGAEHQFVLNTVDNNYYSHITFPTIGLTSVYLQANYKNFATDTISFKINSLAYGNVVDGNGQSLAGVQILLYQSNGKLFDLSPYGESNPVQTDANGIYAWAVPNGNYFLVAKKEGYADRQTLVFIVNNNVVNKNLELIKLPPKLEDIIDPNKSLGENAVNVVINLAEKTKANAQIAVQKINDVKNNENVQKTTRQVVVPTAVSVAAFSTLSFISFADILPLLRLLFFQPLLLFGIRKRESWGQIYNALNKQPVDLAIVRLIDNISNNIVQSKVTNKQGRYAFIVEPGKYRIEVTKLNYIFPSVLLKNYQSDGRKIDIYHGEEIEVTEAGTVITANIPLDLEGAHDKLWRLKWEKFGRILQAILSPLGLVVTLVSLYISPVWYVWALLVIHIVFMLFFRRLAKPKKPKGWGIVYDASNKAPLGQTVARLFNAQFNKLVASQVTDRKGRYYFLAGDDKYYVTFEHKDYSPEKTQVVDLSRQDSGIVAVDVGLKPTSDADKPLEIIEKQAGLAEKSEEIKKDENLEPEKLLEKMENPNEEKVPLAPPAKPYKSRKDDIYG